MPDTLAKRELVISSKPENLGLVEKLIDNLCADYNINEEVYGNIIISITEAVNNAINHGNNGNPNLDTIISCTIKADQICFTITDQGPGFNYNNLPDPTAPENLESISGRGVFLMQQLAEEVKFNESGNQVELSFSFVAN